MNPFCDECNKEVEIEIAEVKKPYHKDGFHFEVEHRKANCLECGSEVSNETIDDEALKAVWAEYRRLTKEAQQ